MSAPAHIAALTDADLLQYHANAATTFAQSGGHFKAGQNDNLARAYRAELERRGLTPDWRLRGIFNGDGSY